MPTVAGRALAACIALAGLAAAVQARAEVDPLGALIERLQSAPTAVDPVTAFASDAVEMVVTLYHSGARGVGPRDSLGCKVEPMRTAAVDRTVIPRRSILYIEDTVGMPLPGGGEHDGYWYASDTGGAIKGRKIDLFTGIGAKSMTPFYQRDLNLDTVEVAIVGVFEGCPPSGRSGRAVASR